MAWKFMYGTMYTVMDDFLVFRFYDEGRLTYMIPLGKGIVDQNIINKLFDDANLIGEPFRMLASREYMDLHMDKECMKIFKIEADRAFSEYIYKREHLAELDGSKYHPKRNHVHQFFTDYPDWRYEELRPEIIPECLSMENKWYQAKREKNPTTIDEEKRALIYALDNMNETSSIGGVLFVNGKITAFTLGCPINWNTFGVHFEKANTEFEGSYAVINQLFAQHIPEQFEFINREEDLGMAGLRQAKLSYYPDLLLDRCILTKNE